MCHLGENRIIALHNLSIQTQSKHTPFLSPTSMSAPLSSKRSQLCRFLLLLRFRIIVRNRTVFFASFLLQFSIGKTNQFLVLLDLVQQHIHQVIGLEIHRIFVMPITQESKHCIVPKNCHWNLCSTCKELGLSCCSTTRNRFHAAEQRFQFYGQGTGAIFPVR
jgi:hypothetical protein